MLKVKKTGICLPNMEHLSFHLEQQWTKARKKIDAHVIPPPPPPKIKMTTLNESINIKDYLSNTNNNKIKNDNQDLFNFIYT